MARSSMWSALLARFFCSAYVGTGSETAVEQESQHPGVDSTEFYAVGESSLRYENRDGPRRAVLITRPAAVGDSARSDSDRVLCTAPPAAGPAGRERATAGLLGATRLAADRTAGREYAGGAARLRSGRRAGACIKPRPQKSAPRELILAHPAVGCRGPKLTARKLSSPICF